MSKPEPLRHVCSAAAWDALVASGSAAYAPDSLSQDGFLHLCTAAQLPFVLRRFFAGQGGLVVLHIDSAQVGAEIRWERSEPGMDPFPHLYGVLPVAAVTAVQPVEGLHEG